MLLHIKQEEVKGNFKLIYDNSCPESELRIDQAKESKKISWRLSSDEYVINFVYNYAEKIIKFQDKQWI